MKILRADEALTMDVVSDARNLKKIIDRDILSIQKSEMLEGQLYYDKENVEIMNRKMLYVDNSGGTAVLKEDPFKSNFKSRNGFMKLLVDQKVNYLVGENPSISCKEEKYKEYADLVLENMGDKFYRTLSLVLKEAAKKGIGYCMPYITEEGKLSFESIEPREMKCIYKDGPGKILKYAIRYYKIDVQNSKGEIEERKVAEVWSKDACFYYMENESKQFEFIQEQYTLDCLNIIQNPLPNVFRFYTEFVTGERRIKDVFEWGKIPFIPLYNNTEFRTDLALFKDHNDAYDILSSDGVNNLLDIKDVFYIIKNYGGDPSKLASELQHRRAIAVDDNGGVDTVTTEIPHEARQTTLENVRKSLYRDGMGVDMEGFRRGNVTNDEIKSMYTNLDLKCKDLKGYAKDFIYDCLYFAIKYCESMGIIPSNTLTAEDFEIKFNETIITNTAETIKSLTELRGLVDDRSLVEKIPGFDAQLVMDRLEEQQKQFSLDNIPSEE